MKSIQKNVILASFFALCVLLTSCAVPDANAPLTSDTDLSEMIAPLQQQNTNDTVIEFYRGDASKPIDLSAISDKQVDIDNIMQGVLSFYKQVNPEYPQEQVDLLRIYELPERNDWIVLAGKDYYGWPGCSPFIYRNSKLLPLMLDNDFFDQTLIEFNIASEIYINFGADFSSPILEVYAYSHQGNGVFYLCSLRGDSLEYILSDSIRSWYFSDWEQRNNAIFINSGLESDDFFDCNYEDLRPIVSYEDKNNDGYVDIVIVGNYQCMTSDGRVLMSESTVDTLIFNPLWDTFTYNAHYSIKSPLRIFWGADSYNADPFTSDFTG